MAPFFQNFPFFNVVQFVSILLNFPDGEYPRSFLTMTGYKDTFHGYFSVIFWREWNLRVKYRDIYVDLSPVKSTDTESDINWYSTDLRNKLTRRKWSPRNYRLNSDKFTLFRITWTVCFLRHLSYADWNDGETRTDYVIDSQLSQWLFLVPLIVSLIF